VRIQLAQAVYCRSYLWSADICNSIEQLAVQIGDFDSIEVSKV
jgi:hypothetical protein